MEGKLVMIAEDDELLRHLYERKFSLAGFNIHTAESGDVVMQLLETETPDLLILDINMPGMDGFQILEKLPPEERLFPVLMLSNFADTSNKERAKELQADRFLEKQHITIKQLLVIAKDMMKL